MSSVLKALKKLEEARRGAGVVPSAATGQRWASGGQSPHSQRPWLLLAVGLALGLLLAGLLVWFGRRDVQEVVAPAGAALPTASTQPAEITPVRMASAVSGAVSAIDEAVPESPAKTPPPATPRISAASAPAAPSIAAARPPRSALPPRSMERGVEQVRIDRLEIPAPGQQWVAPPQLTLSEIFPPQAGERMAIVNGLPVMVGTMVDEALIEEIYDDRILVSIGGKRVVVPLQKGR